MQRPLSIRTAGLIHAALVLAITLAAGCSSDTDVPASTSCATDDDCTGGRCVGGLCVSDGGDTGPTADTAMDTTDDGDASDPDATDAGSADVVEPDAGDAGVDTPPPPGEFGEDCDEDLDCASGICLQLADGGVCTVPCAGECPDAAWECRLLTGSGGDLIEICVPPRDVLCNPCERDLDCGGLEDLCVPQLDGQGCGLACGANDDCPTGFICQDVESVDGRGDQCVPALGICGGCLDADGDRHGQGPTCLGTDCDDLDVSIYDGAAELCDGADNDCDDVVDEGFDFARSVTHCGACNATCEADNATVTCDEGACAIDACLPGFYDLDADYANGCEYACTPADTGVEACNGIDDDCDGAIDEDFDLDTDVDHCGRCERVCTLDASVAVCIDGECAVGECIAPRADCNGAVDDGCEIDTLTDPAHCGGCGAACALPFATPGCAAGVCTVAACADDRGDCNGDPVDGCEVALLTAVAHCGACDAACPDVANGTPVCAEATCGIGVCNDGWLDCNRDPADGCEASDRAVTSCLRCGNTCTYANGVPGCADEGCFLAACDDGWVNLDGNPANGCEYACTVTNAGVEICDGIDNDCDGAIDEDAVDAPTWFRDGDGDTWGRSDTTRVICEAPGGFTSRGGDCNDANPAVNPGAAEICNGVNDDCDDAIDEGLSFDRDGDGRYAIGSCATPADDCNDSEPRAYPGNVEVCDGIDNDCDRTIDEPGSVGCTTYYLDGDRDGFGSPSSQCTCSASGGFDVTNNRDCYDRNFDARPGQTSWFSSHRGDSSYDYDCNGTAEPRWTGRSGTCSLFGDLCDGGSPGWSGAAPACGSSGTWESNCEFYVQAWPPATGCRWASRASRVQQCR